MRKYGKFERMPDGTRAKPPKVKNVLLQTYFTSLLCMVLCVSMFFGTSYAWFTSEVNNQANEIYIGTLKVGLYKGDTNLNGSDTKLFDGAIRWEPGYTALETIKVVNEGDLAFKYMMSFTDGSVSVEDPNNEVQPLATVASNFEVWVFDHLDGEYVKPASYEEMTGTKGWTMVGTLDQLLNGTHVLEGSMVTVRKGDLNPEATAAADGTVATEGNVFDGVATEDTYTIALHMKKSANDPKLMGQKIGLNVKLVAYQQTKEADAFGSYDRLVMTPADLKEAMEKGGNVTLLADIKLTESVEVPKDVVVNLDLNGHTISQEKAQTTAYAMIMNKGTLTVTDSIGTGKISYADTTTYSADNGYASNTIRNEGTLNIYGGTIENTSSDNVMSYGYPHAIDCYQGSFTNIYGGTVKSVNYDAIRMFCNSTTLATTVNISGGNIINRVSFQNPSSDQAGYGVLNITGGKFVVIGGVNANVRLLNFSTNISNMKAAISGGEFDKGVKTQNQNNVAISTSNWLKVTNVTVNEVQ